MATSSGAVYRAPGREHLDRRVERIRRLPPEKRSAGAPAAVAFQVLCTAAGSTAIMACVELHLALADPAPVDV